MRIGREGTWMCGCFAHGVEGVADALGVAASTLIEDPWPWLKPHVIGRPGGERAQASTDKPPSDDRVKSWAHLLVVDREHRRRLEGERGLTRATIAQYEIGWDPIRSGYTLPIRDAAGRIVNVSWRAPRGSRLDLPSGRRLKMTRLAIGVEDGGLPLYPTPPGRHGLLVEGEWDALIARQAGLPAFTGLLGKQWNSAWNDDAAGRVIPVLYDAGAEEDAARTVERLREAGAREAWVVPLDLPGEGDDLSDWFVKYGRSGEELFGLVRRARSEAA